MSFNRREADKKRSRRAAGTYGPPRKKKNKGIANRNSRHNVRIELHRHAVNILTEKEDA